MAWHGVFFGLWKVKLVKNPWKNGVGIQFGQFPASEIKSDEG